jgi:hypothetical protein
MNAVFRTFLANGNDPLSASELGAKLNRPPSLLLRVLVQGRAYNGVKPINPS